MTVYENSKYAVVLRKSHTREEMESIDTANMAVGRAFSREIVYPINLIGDGVDPFNAWYEVINKEHGITEFRSPMLPEAMQVADGAEYQLVHLPWKVMLTPPQAMQEPPGSAPIGGLPFLAN
jgi:hypothetical protein